MVLNSLPRKQQHFSSPLNSMTRAAVSFSQVTLWVALVLALEQVEVRLAISQNMNVQRYATKIEMTSSSLSHGIAINLFTKDTKNWELSPEPSVVIKPTNIQVLHLHSTLPLWINPILVAKAWGTVYVNQVWLYICSGDISMCNHHLLWNLKLYILRPQSPEILRL